MNRVIIAALRVMNHDYEPPRPPGRQAKTGTSVRSDTTTTVGMLCGQRSMAYHIVCVVSRVYTLPTSPSIYAVVMSVSAFDGIVLRFGALRSIAVLLILGSCFLVLGCLLQRRICRVLVTGSCTARLTARVVRLNVVSRTVVRWCCTAVLRCVIGGWTYLGAGPVCVGGVYRMELMQAQ